MSFSNVGDIRYYSNTDGYVRLLASTFYEEEGERAYKMWLVEDCLSGRCFEAKPRDIGSAISEMELIAWASKQKST